MIATGTATRRDGRRGAAQRELDLEEIDRLVDAVEELRA
jgi:hypothetical protein